MTPLLGTRGKPARWQVGSYFAIPAAGYFAFGRITGVSLAAFYDVRSKELMLPDDLDNKPILSSWVVSWKGVTTGRWPVIGRRQLEPRLTVPVKFVYAIPIKTYIRLYGPNNSGDIIEITSEDPGVMEEAVIHPWWSVVTRLANHFAHRRCLAAEGARFKPLAQRIAEGYSAERWALAQSGGDGPASEWPGILTQVFEYDDAAAWAGALVKSRDGAALSRALASIPIGKHAWSLIPRGLAAWAAAAIVAAAADGDCTALPPEMAAWTSRHGRSLKLDELKPAAAAALKQIAARSELHGLWIAAGTETACRRRLDDLIARLS
jgi:hypothetical protein